VNAAISIFSYIPEQSPIGVPNRIELTPIVVKKA